MKTPVTLLRHLHEGDEFYFIKRNKKEVVSKESFIVEGQYPKFHCTTVCRKSHITPCSSGGLHMTMVTGVEDTQEVKVIEQNMAHICHKVTFKY